MSKEIIKRMIEKQKRLNEIKEASQKHYWTTGKNLPEYNKLHNEIVRDKKEIAKINQAKATKKVADAFVKENENLITMVQVISDDEVLLHLK